MNKFVSVLINAEHSTVAWLEKELHVLQGEAPTIAKLVDVGLTYVGPILTDVVTAEAGQEAGAVVAAVIKEAQSDLAAVNAAIYDFGSSKSASDVLNAVKNNLGALLTAGHVKDASSVARVTKVVNEIGVLAASVAPVIAAVEAAK